MYFGDKLPSIQIPNAFLFKKQSIICIVNFIVLFLALPDEDESIHSDGSDGKLIPMHQLNWLPDDVWGPC